MHTHNNLSSREKSIPISLPAARPAQADDALSVAARAESLIPRHVNTGVTTFPSVSTPKKDVFREPVSVIRQLSPLDCWTNNYIALDTPCVDYLTLTTFDKNAAYQILSFCEKHIDKSQLASAKRQQYTGFSTDGFFFGSGIQKSLDHYRIEFSGLVSHLFLLSARRSNLPLDAFRCTRIDVQLTIETLPSTRLSEIAPLLEDISLWGNRASRPSLSAFRADDGRDTLYIGKRGGNRMQRLYIKPVAAVDYFRWETEFREELSRNLWQLIITEGLSSLASVLSGEVDVVPVVDPSFRAVASALAVPPVRLRLKRNTTDNDRKMAWLEHTVLPCLRSLQHSDPKFRMHVHSFLAAAADVPGVVQSPSYRVSFFLPDVLDLDYLPGD